MYIKKIDSTRLEYNSVVLELDYKDLHQIVSVFDRLEDCDILTQEDEDVRYHLKYIFDILRYGKINKESVSNKEVNGIETR